jgi:ribosomal protein L11 methyltransferase
MMRRHASGLETISVIVPADALKAYEAALAAACGTIGLFHDEDADLWTVEGVKDQGSGESELVAGLALAALVTGVEAAPMRRPTAAGGWLERTREAFPEQLVGRRFAIRGTHVRTPATLGRLTIVLDASVAFGSGEHGSTRGCLRALERVAHRRPRRILDLGTGSGILALAAARLLHRHVLGTDIEPWSVRTAAANASLNRLGKLTRFVRADGWASPVVTVGGPYDLVFANILARPLCLMARQLARNLAPGGTAILAGLLTTQARWVLVAHRRHGLVLESTLAEGKWCTLHLRRR